MPDKDPVAALMAARALEPKQRKNRKPRATGISTRPNTEPGDYRGGQMTLRELHRLAADHTPAALRTLAAIMVEGRDADRIKCAEILLARAWGNPVTPIEHGGTIEVAAGAREKLAAILERIGDIPRKTEVIEAEFTAVVPSAVPDKTETTTEVTSKTVLKPPPQKPDDE